MMKFYILSAIFISGCTVNEVPDDVATMNKLYDSIKLYKDSLPKCVSENNAWMVMLKINNFRIEVDSIERAQYERRLHAP